MSTYFQKPENALKRSEELISVGQKNAALDVLDMVIKSKRHRQWTPILEDILKKFLSLCTEARQPRRAKDGLIQYRGIASNHAQGPDSILKVVTSFIGDGEKAVREAEEKAGLGADAVANLQDLEAEETPETMMVSVLTGDLSDTGRADRDNYVQWLRFLWESYRTCLEVLKNNPKLEELYADTAKKTFMFCVNYTRKLEFRRLKDLLKTHMQTAPQSDNSLRLRVEIRVEQLNAATKLDLWQLAFESAEELHAVIMLSQNRKTSKSKVMMTYYDKLSQVFWVSENYLFHACAMQKIYNLTERQLNREMSKRDVSKQEIEEALKTLASKLLLGALSVPSQHHKALEIDFDPEKDKQQRMATLVGHAHHVPHRKAVIADLVQRNVIPMAHSELRSLYEVLEVEFDPLSLGAKVKPILKFVEGNAELAKYLTPLKKTVLLKLVQQLGKVYQTMRIGDFAKLADFMSLHDCEKFIVEVVAKGQVSVRLDHKNGTLNFGDHTFEGDVMRTQLTNFGKGLQGVLDLIQTDLKVQVRQQKVLAFKQLAESLDDERKMMMNRSKQIEDRKEMVEKEAAIKASEESMRKKIEEEERRLQEEIRKDEDKKRREEERKKQEKIEKENAEKKRLKEQLDALKAQNRKNKGEKVGEEVDEDELAKIDKMQLLAAKKEEEEKLKREAEERIAQQVQKLDHLERARRENERDLLQELFVKQKAEDKIRWEVDSKQSLENHKKKHEEDVQTKQRMLRMVEDKSKYEALVLKRRKEEYEREKQEYKDRMRKEQARKAKEKEERERREKEEQEARAREEEKKRQIFEEEKRKREEERAHQDAMLEKQRQREAEIEAKQREREGGMSGGRDGPRDAPRDAPSDRWGGGGVRRDEPPRASVGSSSGRGTSRDAPASGGASGWRDDRGPSSSGGAGAGTSGRYQPPGARGGGLDDRDRDPPRSGGFGDRDRDGPRPGGFGDRDRDGPRPGGFGDRDRDGPRPGGFGDRDRDGPRSGGFGDRDGPRSGAFGDRPRDDRGPPRDDGPRGGGGFGERRDDGPRSYGDRPRDGGDRYGSGSGGFGDRGGGDRGGGGGFGDRDRAYGSGPRDSGRDDRGGMGSSRYDRPPERSSDWGSIRRDEDRGAPPSRDAPPSERPRLQLAPRTVPKSDAPSTSSSSAPAPKGDGDDGFTTVKKR